MMVITSLGLKWLYEPPKVASESYRSPSITIMFRHADYARSYILLLVRARVSTIMTDREFLFFAQEIRKIFKIVLFNKIKS